MIALALSLALASTAHAQPCSELSSGDFKKLFFLLDQDFHLQPAWKQLEKKVEASKAACAPRFAQKPELASCLDNLSLFVTNQRMTRGQGHSMQFRLADDEYIAAQPREMISFPDELKNGLPADPMSLCKAKGWSCVEFVSKSLPNPPLMSFKRFLVMAPGETFDRWMLFTLPKKGTAEHLIDFLAVEKASHKLHFIEYWRDSKGQNPVPRQNIASCYKCHPSGMRDIVPAYGSTDAEGLKTAKALNQLMRAYRPFDFGEGTVIPAAYGPPMGERQTCTKCHDGEYRGVLNAAHLGERSRHQIYFKMAQDLAMPPARAKVAEYQVLFDSFKRSEQLTQKDREELYSPNPVPPFLGVIGLGFGASKGPTAVSNEKLLKFLRKKGLLTKTELEASLDLLEKVEDEADRDYREMKADYRVRLETWLKGDKPECAQLF